jgi:glyoxylase-like metal-dependent hydrolase (beta-lactamase superfamily II)
MSWRTAVLHLVLGMAVATQCVAVELSPKPVVTAPRVYVMDCGTIVNDMPETFGLTRDEVQRTTMAVMCFLIVHPKGTLLWDTGITDRWAGRPIYENADRHIGRIKLNTVIGQLADIGYSPDMIDYLSLSHSHYDHSGNANAFARSTWLVSKQERDFMFPTAPGPKYKGFDDYALLQASKTVLVQDNHDVFGDGSVVIRQAPGHTPGHSILQVNLKQTGPIILAGDLYHYPEELTLKRIPDREKATGTPQARARIEALAKEAHAQIWIAHDMDLFRKLRREPAYYE